MIQLKERVWLYRKYNIWEIAFFCNDPQSAHCLDVTNDVLHQLWSVLLYLHGNEMLTQCHHVRLACVDVKTPYRLLKGADATYSELLTHGRSKFFPLVEGPSVATALPLSISMGSAMASGQTDCQQYTRVMPDDCLYTLFRLHASRTRIYSEQEQQVDTCHFTETQRQKTETQALARRLGVLLSFGNECLNHRETVLDS